MVARTVSMLNDVTTSDDDNDGDDDGRGGGGEGHEFFVILSQSSRPIPHMIHSVHERDLSRIMNLCWPHIETYRVSVGDWISRGRTNPSEMQYHG